MAKTSPSKNAQMKSTTHGAVRNMLNLPVRTTPIVWRKKPAFDVTSVKANGIYRTRIAKLATGTVSSYLGERLDVLYKEVMNVNGMSCTCVSTV